MTATPIASRAAALLAALALSLGLTAAVTVPASATETGSISGTVTVPSGATTYWYSYVTVELYSDDYDTSVNVNADGTYSATGLPEGDYTVVFYAATASGLLSEYYDDVFYWSGHDTFETVPVATGEAVTGISADLELAGTITGTIDPPAGASDTWYEDVTVYVEDGDYWKLGAISTDGTYTVTGLPAGTYLVQIRAGAGSGLATVFYGDTQDADDASVAIVTAGATTSGIDVGLDADDSLGSMSGTLETSEKIDGAWRSGMRIQVYSETCPASTDGENMCVAYTDDIRADGYWYIDGLPAGDYAAHFWPLWGANVLDQYYGDATEYVDAERVTVGDDEDVTGIDATLQVASMISGTVSVEAAADADLLDDVLVTAWLLDEDGTGGSSDQQPTEVNADGTYTIEGLDSGTYILYFYTGDWLSGVTTSDLGAEYYGDTVSWSEATRVTLEVPEVVTGADVTLGAGVYSSTPAPTVSYGTLTVGSYLVATINAWTPSTYSFTYQWYRDGEAIDGAEYAAYKLTSADIGTTITFSMTSTLQGWETKTVTSAAVTVPGANLTASTPTISGTLKAGSTLTANPGVWTDGVALTYQWLRDGSKISGATSSTYTLTAADRGHKITVKITGSKSGYTTATKSSASVTVPLAALTAATPTFSGTLKSGYTLTAKAGAWTSGATLKYQWYRDGSKISGATARTYKLTTADRGHKITVKVTGKKSGYTTVTKTSASKYIKRVLSASKPVIKGTTKVGKRLKAAKGTWTSGTKITYQWYNNGHKIKGATGQYYRLKKSDKGDKITVKVTGKKSGYWSTTKTSRAVRIH
ncbi:carboxypeptidase-like regulatory domain-containing protein [Demequina salsinemoris]|uniref:carboxypeptidase-like regulatory domain-containing protein n=1 Tax=Demequina salsinemoris TaxID=577470 RepID=UPI0007815AD8|nr:carboxypeptidase-like regulatory domain-containing protein [Demequina salsinemoris]